MRLSVGVSLLLAAGYATLPWWVPTGYIKHVVAKQLSQQAGSEITIDSLSLSWSRGVELRGVKIASPDGFGPEPLAEVDSLRMDLSPIDMVIHKRCAWLEIVSPRVFVRQSGNGQINTGPLTRLQFDTSTTRLTVRQGQVLFCGPAGGEPVRLHIGDAELNDISPRGLSKLTLAGCLQQSRADAPLALRFTAAPVQPGAAAAASMNFSDVDLSELGLAELLGLPAGGLRGKCSGSAELLMDRQGRIDDVTVKLTVRGLDVRTASPAALPVIDEASIELSASVDPFASPDGLQLNLRKVAIRIPGIDIKGGAVVFIPADGKGPRIESTELSGVIDPSAATAMLRARPAGAPELACSGPVKISSLRLSRVGPDVNLAVALDATGAQLVRDGVAIKPAGCALLADLSGRLDDRSGTFVADRFRVQLGENWIEQQVQLAGVTAMLEQCFADGWAAASSESLSVLASRGRWQVRELDSLRRIGAAEALSGAELEGQIEGDWDYAARDAQKGHGQFEANLTVPAATHLAMAGAFAKPSGREVRVNLAGQWVDRGPARWDGDLDVLLDRMDFSVGAGRLHTDGGRLSLRGGVSAASLTAQGRFDVRNVESLMEGFTALAGLEGRITGHIPRGTYNAVIENGRSNLAVSANLDELAVEMPGRFAKPARQPARLELAAQGAVGGAAGQAQLTLRLGVTSNPPPESADAPLTLVAHANLPSGGDAQSVPAVASLDITLHDADAAWLLSTFPVVPAGEMPYRLGGVALTGRISSGPLSKTKAEFQADLSCQADAMEIRLPGRDDPAKPAGVPLRARIRGRAVRDGDSLSVAVNEKSPVEFTFGGSTVVASGDVSLRLGDGPRNRVLLQSIDASVAAAVNIGPELAPASPAIDSVIRRYGLSGSLSLACRVRGDAESLEADLTSLDATELRVEQLGSLCKPAGLTVVAQGQAGIRLADGLCSIRNLRGSVGAVDFLAEADWRFAGRGDDLAIRSVTLHSAGLQARLGGQDVFLAGKLALHDVAPNGQVLPRIGRLTADELEVRVGQNHGWLTFDVDSPMTDPHGSINLLAEHLDTENVAIWLAGLSPESPTGPAASHSASAPATQPTTRPTMEQANRQASELLELLRDRFAKADLNFSMRAEYLRIYDASIDLRYGVRNVNVSAAIKNGRTSISYAGGLSGGAVRGEFQADLNAPAPQVSSKLSVTDLLASPEIQPQMAKYFPGNDVGGTFSRTEESTASLVDTLAEMIGSPRPAYPVGTARTLTTDGVIAGQGAPEYVTKIFPSLNLTIYRYITMTGFAEMMADGSARNDMIFEGKTYDIYIEGVTGPDHVGRYQIGVILLAAPQSPEWNHAYKLGRIPIMNFKARIEGGKMHDVKVFYLRPDEILAGILVRNNPLFRALFTFPET